MSVVFENQVCCIPKLSCQNNKCITFSEKYLPRLFYFDAEGSYRCSFCDQKAVAEK